LWVGERWGSKIGGKKEGVYLIEVRREGRGRSLLTPEEGRLRIKKGWGGKVGKTLRNRIEGGRIQKNAGLKITCPLESTPPPETPCKHHRKGQPAATKNRKT